MCVCIYMHTYKLLLVLYICTRVHIYKKYIFYFVYQHFSTKTSLVIFSWFIELLELGLN